MLSAAPASAVPDADPERTWLRQFGTSAVEEANDVAAGGSGLYVGGSTAGAFPDGANAGAEDAFLRRFDVAGETVWTRQFGTASADVVESVTVGASGVYVAGRTEGQFADQPAAGADDAFLARFDLAGNLVWLRQFGTAGDDGAVGVVVRRAGVFVAGSTSSTFTDATGSGATDAFVRRYDHEGTAVWTRQFGSAGADQVEDLAGNGSGIYVAGSTSGGLRRANEGGLDAFVRKFSGAGRHKWTRQFGSTTNDVASGIAVGPTGVYAAGVTEGTLGAGSSAGGRDGFLRRFSGNGRRLWTEQFGTISSDEATSVAVTRASVFVAGQTFGTFSGQTTSGGADAFVRRFGPGSGAVWTHQFGTGTTEGASGVAARASGVYAAGDTTGAFAGQSSAGSTDAFLVRIVSFAPDGMISKKFRGDYAGNDLYNEVGGAQTKSAAVERGERASFYVRAQNDGDARDSLEVDGCESSDGFRVRYFWAGHEITDPVAAGAFEFVNVKPGAARTLRVVVRVGRGADAGAAKECLIAIESGARPAKRDVVKAVVKARG